MKFERLLQIYWTRGFLHGGRTFSFNITPNNLLKSFATFGRTSRLRFSKRFELTIWLRDDRRSLASTQLEFREILNMYFSQAISINHSIFELMTINLIRLYLTRTFRGRAQALGKPSRGQRTWSNAWTAYRHNKTLRHFVRDVAARQKKIRNVLSLNKKKIQRKIKKIIHKRRKSPRLFKKNNWF